MCKDQAREVPAGERAGHRGGLKLGSRGNSEAEGNEVEPGEVVTQQRN